MILLAIDTSGPFCSAALYDCGTNQPIASIAEDLGRGHAERLMPMLEEILLSNSLGWKNVQRLAVVHGPGSFTGLRVGLAVARGLSMALGIPCTGVSVFEACAYASGNGEPITVAMDAKRGEVWLQKFDAEFNPTSDPLALKVDEDQSTLLGNVSRVAGSGAELLAGLAKLPLIIIDTSPSPPIEAVAAFAALQVPTSGKPHPLYLRTPDAKPQNALIEPG